MCEHGCKRTNTADIETYFLSEHIKTGEHEYKNTIIVTYTLAVDKQLNSNELECIT